MIDKQSILKNVNQPEERLLLAKVLDQAIFSLKKHENTFTSFCDPKKMNTILKSISGINELNFFVFGGNDDCERRRIGFCPNYREIKDEEFPISAIKIVGNTRFSKELTHRDFLGSILGLGIDRGKIGDIFMFESYAVAFVADEIAEYIKTNLERIGRAVVKTEIKSLSEVQLAEKLTVEKSTTVSSLRLDALVSAAFNMSRSKAQELISVEKVFVNWTVNANGSKLLAEEDLISVRGFGRAKLSKIVGRTKKDRISVIFLKYV